MTPPDPITPAAARQLAERLRASFSTDEYNHARVDALCIKTAAALESLASQVEGLQMQNQEPKRPAYFDQPPHPWYGPCDAFGGDGQWCAECARVMLEQDGELLAARDRAEKAERELAEAKTALEQARREYGAFGSLSGETLIQMEAAVSDHPTGKGTG